MDNFLLYNGFNTGIKINLKNGFGFEFDSDKRNPLDDITIIKGILYLDETDFNIDINKVAPIECWDNDKIIEDMPYIKFI